MSYDFGKILGKIIERYGSQKDFAKALGISERTCSLKLNNKIEWKQTEISKACKLLKINDEDIPGYFFKLKVL